MTHKRQRCDADADRGRKDRPQGRKACRQSGSRHARLRPGISYDYASPTNILPVVGNLWKEFFQDCKVQAQHSFELPVGGIVAEMHMAGGVDLLLGAEL